MQHPFGVAGCAGRIEHECGIFGGRVGRPALRRTAFEQRPEIAVTRGGFGAGSATNDDRRPEGRCVPQNMCTTLITFLSRDQHMRAAISQPVAQGVWAKQHGEWQDDRTELAHRDVRDHRFRALREIEADDAVRADAERRQRIGEAAGQFIQPAAGINVLRSIGLHIDQSRRVGT